MANYDKQIREVYDLNDNLKWALVSYGKNQPDFGSTIAEEIVFDIVHAVAAFRGYSEEDFSPQFFVQQALIGVETLSRIEVLNPAYYGEQISVQNFKRIVSWADKIVRYNERNTIVIALTEYQNFLREISYAICFLALGDIRNLQTALNRAEQIC